LSLKTFLMYYFDFIGVVSFRSLYWLFPLLSLLDLQVMFLWRLASIRQKCSYSQNCRLGANMKHKKLTLQWRPQDEVSKKPTCLIRKECSYQGCGSGSGLDPDSETCVDPDPYWESGSGSRGKKTKKFQWKKCTF
jgi:hypothetical protein